LITCSLSHDFYPLPLEPYPDSSVGLLLSTDVAYFKYYTGRPVRVYFSVDTFLPPQSSSSPHDMCEEAFMIVVDRYSRTQRNNDISVCCVDPSR
jgi:hypothetical protein